MTAGKSGGYSDTQREAFGALVADGAYSVEFEHADPLKAFVANCIGHAAAHLPDKEYLDVLDCGCGTGTWLSFLYDRLATDAGRTVNLHGFDLTPEMADVAREKLSAICTSDRIKVGDILKAESYHFGDRDRFDLVFAYDVVQQLPRPRQFDACRIMLDHVAPGGVLVMFDHDRHSSYGRRMGFRKFVTQYLGVPLVPRYYCNAKYPPLAHFAADLAKGDSWQTEIIAAPDGRKRALLARRAG